MSSKKTSGNPNSRLYQKRNNITPSEKRTSSNAQNQKNKSSRRNVAKDLKPSLTKQDLIKQHIELLDELQNLKAQLELAEKENKKLKKNLRKLEDENQSEEEYAAPKNRKSNSKYLDEDDTYNENEHYNDYDYDQNEEEEENFNQNRYEEDEEEEFDSDSI